jgi:hypothetical protein
MCIPGLVLPKAQAVPPWIHSPEDKHPHRPSYRKDGTQLFQPGGGGEGVGAAFTEPKRGDIA